MKFILVSPKNRTVYNFRGELIKRIISYGYEVVVTGPDRTSVERIEALGARFVEIPMNKNGVNPKDDIKYQKALRRLFEEEKPDVVLGYTAKPVIYGSIAAKQAGVPHVAAMVTGVGYAFTATSAKARTLRMIMSALYKRAFKSADTVIFQNGDDRALFVGRGLVKEEKCRTVNGSGVDTKRFSVAPLPERTTFFMLARVMRSKGICEYLEACRTVKEKYPDVRCMLLGACEGIQDSLSQETLAPYLEDGIVEHFGETDKVEDYFSQCSVYVLPSYREGTPRTVLEAMSMGRPIITTDAPGCRSTTENGKTGFLVPVRDSDAVAEKMIYFIEHPESVKAMGDAAAEYCREKFDVERVNDDMCEYLKIQEEK